MINKSQSAGLGLVVFAAGAGSLGIALADSSSTPVETGPPNTGWYTPTAVTPKTTVASGRANGAAYAVRSFKNDKGDVCIEVREGATDVTGSCGPEPTSDRPIGTTITEDTPGNGERLVIGVADASVASVEAQTASTRTAVAPAAQQGAALGKVFVVKLHSASEAASLKLTAKDSTGGALAAPVEASGPVPHT